MFQVLVSLADGEKHGYAIIKEVARARRGKVRLRPSTFYAVLARFDDDGLVAKPASGRIPHSTTSGAATTVSRIAGGRWPSPRRPGSPTSSPPRRHPSPSEGLTADNPNSTVEIAMQDRFFRTLLRLLPEDLRAGYGRDIEATFRAEWREAGSGRFAVDGSLARDRGRRAAPRSGAALRSPGQRPPLSSAHDGSPARALARRDRDPRPRDRRERRPVRGHRRRPACTAAVRRPVAGGHRGGEGRGTRPATSAT